MYVSVCQWGSRGLEIPCGHYLTVQTPPAGGTHPTGMLSCFTLLLVLKKQFFTFRVAHMICGGIEEVKFWLNTQRKCTGYEEQCLI